MLHQTNPNGTLTPWGAQHQIGLLVKDPAGKVARLLGFDLDDICLVEYVEPFIVTELYSHQLRPCPVPLTPETVYVGLWVRDIARPCLIGQIRHVHGQWDKEDGDDTFYARIAGAGFDDFQADIADYEALPGHCQQMAE